jgi:uncharacterized protein (TIGR02677 family)
LETKSSMNDVDMTTGNITPLVEADQDNRSLSQHTQADTYLTPSERFSSSTIFNLTDRLPIFSYLVTSNRVRWYRIIMRTFLQHHREQYHYQLTAQEIRDAVRSAFDADYTLEQCQNDLAALKEWGNLTTIYDSSRATSIASFLSPALLYQATPEAIAIETFLDEQMRARTVRGSLRQGDLPRLWHSLQLLDEDLRLPPPALTATHSREMAEEWQRVFEIWNTMAHEAAQYLAAMVNAAQHGQADLESYQAYKAAVVAYVQSFAQALTEYSRQIRTLLADWTATGKRERLIEIIAQYLEPPAPTLEQKRTLAELLQDARNQVEALTNWFAPGKNADSFRRNALAEVDKVVRRATALAVSTRPSANYAASLNALAYHLLQASDGERAQQLFSTAFAHLLPVHLPESLAGSPSAAYDPGKDSAWQEPPTVELRLRPISRANRGDHPLEDPVIDNRTIVRQLVAEYQERLQEERERFERIFSAKFLDIGAIASISVEERAILLVVIDGCLSSTSHQYGAPDGSTIVLLNPDEQTFATLHAPDGVLLLPRYRLQCQELDGISV